MSPQWWMTPRIGSLATSPFPTDETGYQQLKQLAEVPGSTSPGSGVEGTGSYGAGLARYLTEIEYQGPRGKPTQPAAATPIRQNRHG